MKKYYISKKKTFKKGDTMQAEKAIEQYLVRCIKLFGGMCVKLQNTGYNGIPDRLVLLDGKAIFVELKAPDGRLSEVQKARHKQLQKLGFNVYTLWNFEQVDWFLQKELHKGIYNVRNK